MLCGWKGNRAGDLSQTMVVCPATCTVQSLNGRSAAPRPLPYIPYRRYDGIGLGLSLELPGLAHSGVSTAQKSCYKEKS